MDVYSQDAAVPYIIEETNRGKQLYSVQDHLFNQRKIVLDREVNAGTMGSLISQFLYLDETDPEGEIFFFINSPGGEVSSGLALYDVIRMLSAPVTTICTGVAASMGAILFLSGEKRLMLPHTEIMIHDPATSLGQQKALEIGATLERLMKMRKQLAQVIAERTGQELEAVMEKTKRDSYFDAEEAIQFGLATGILKKLPGTPA